MFKYLDENMMREIILSFQLIDNNDMSDDKKMKILYALSNNIENNYRDFKIKKKNGGYRTISEPSYILKSIQRKILENYLYEMKPSKHVKSYIKGLSISDNARVHVGKKMVLKLDIENFFDNIDFIKIYSSVFGHERLPKQVGILFTNLCTYYGSLPQGAPTSAYISNLILYDFDISVGEWCSARGINYTRYSDDMTFSGDFDVKEVIRFVRKSLASKGLCLNENKIRVINSSQAQLVTGICVNDKLQVERRYRRKIRQEMYYIIKYGVKDHLRHTGYEGDFKHYLRSLYGKILFVLNVNEKDSLMRAYKEYLDKNYDF